MVIVGHEFQCHQVLIVKASVSRKCLLLGAVDAKAKRLVKTDRRFLVGHDRQVDSAGTKQIRCPVQGLSDQCSPAAVATECGKDIKSCKISTVLFIGCRRARKPDDAFQEWRRGL